MIVPFLIVSVFLIIKSPSGFVLAPILLISNSLFWIDRLFLAFLIGLKTKLLDRDILNTGIQYYPNNIIQSLLSLILAIVFILYLKEDTLKLISIKKEKKEIKGVENENKQ